MSAVLVADMASAVSARHGTIPKDTRGYAAALRHLTVHEDLSLRTMTTYPSFRLLLEFTLTPGYQKRKRSGPCAWLAAAGRGSSLTIRPYPQIDYGFVGYKAIVLAPYSTFTVSKTVSFLGRVFMLRDHGALREGNVWRGWVASNVVERFSAPLRQAEESLIQKTIAA